MLYSFVSPRENHTRMAAQKNTERWVRKSIRESNRRTLLQAPPCKRHCTGAPCSHQRTWAEKEGAKPLSLRLSRRKAVEKDRFRPTYAGANMGHPYSVVCMGELGGGSCCYFRGLTFLPIVQYSSGQPYVCDFLV